jgi:solute:Na+ symporter, SSS family
MLLSDMKHVNYLDLLVIGGYLLLLTGVGIYLTRFNKSVDDFFKGGGKIPWWISGLSTFVAGFSAFMFVGAAGYAYRYGAGAIILFTSAFWGYGLGYLVYAVLWRRSRLSSPMEFLTKRYSQGTTYYYTLLSIVPAIMGLGLMIYILCIFVASALGIMGWSVDLGLFRLSGLEVSMIVTGVVMLIYTSAGGLWAVVITDSLQFFIILVVSVLIFPLAFMALGSGSFTSGVSRLLAEAPAEYLSLGDLFTRPEFYLAYFVSTLIGYNAAWHIGQRYYSVPTERDAKKMALMCALFSLVLPFFWIAPTMVARVLFPNIGEMWPQLSVPAEASYVTLALTLLPNGLIGLTISAILAATMTSIDTQLNYLGAILVRDVYVRVRTVVRHSAPNQREQLLMSRITAFSLGILAIITAIIVQRSKGVFDFALMYYSWFSPSMLTPVMLGLVYKKTPSWSANAAATGGLLFVLLMNVGFDVTPYQYEVNIFGGVGVAMAIFFLSALWPERDPERGRIREAFAAELATPVRDEMLRWSGNALESYRIVGILVSAIGLTVLGLTFVPAAPQVHTLSGILGFGTLCMGGLMVWYFRRQGKEAGLVDGRPAAEIQQQRQEQQ